MGLLVAAALLFGGCTLDTTTDRPAPSGSRDQATVNLGWSTLSASEQAEVCDAFWMLDDADIIDYLMSPPDALTRGESEAFVDLLWERC